MSSSLGLNLPAVCLFLGVVVRGQSAGPNAVVVINGQTMLDCNTNDLSLSNWRHSPDGTNNFITISFGCGLITGNDAAYYRTELIGGNICRLTIANVTMQQAGVYNCYDGASTLYKSLVTVIDPVASVVVYNQSEVVESDQLNISCGINYNGPGSPAPSLRPSPYWTTSPGQIFASVISHPSTKVVTVVATVTVQKPTVPVFQCGTVFEITGNTSGYNSTAPADSFAVGSTTEIDVQYPVETMSISSTVPLEDKCISKPETLTCTADANPPAQYIWLDLKNNTNTTGAVLSISSGGEFQCTASNSIRSQTYRETKIVAEASCHPPYNLTITGTECAKDFCTCNGNASHAQQISITCKAKGIPIPSVKWRSDNSFDGLYETIGVTFDGNYTCIASNTYGQKEYSEELIVVVTDCPASSSLVWLTLLTYFEVVWILGGHFIIYYGKSKKKSAYNKHFPFLEKMLPYMNTNANATTFEQCGWIILYILMVTTVGIFVIPFMVIKVQFC
jgi:ATP-dependent protease HslVU (ClpYQ) peptidase subunit